MELNQKQKAYIEHKLNHLSHSKFRSGFHLRKYMITYIDEKGLSIIEEHAFQFIRKNLAPEVIEKDGKQTPMKGHPVFIAQHACACCCRGCLEKWHSIPKGRPLEEREITYLVALIMEWIKKEYANAKGEKDL